VDYYLKSGAGAIIYSNRAWSNGEKMVPTTADVSSNVDVARCWVWEVTTAGTSTGTPTWPASVTQDSTTVTQNGVVWTARRPGWQNASTRNWAFATIYLQYAALAMAAGDRLFASQAHSESWPEAVFAHTVDFVNSTILQPCQVFCVNDAQTDPTLMARATGATVAAQQMLNISANGLAVSDFTLQSAMNHASNRDVQLAANADGFAGICQVYERCTLQIGNNADDATIAPLMNDHFAPIRSILNDCLFRFGGVNQYIECAGGTEINGGGLHASSAAIDTLFRSTQSDGTYMIMTGFDLSGAAQDLYLFDGASLDTHIGGGRVIVRECRMPNNWNGGLFRNQLDHETVIELYNCSDALGNKWRLWNHGLAGNVRDDTTVYRPGGASDYGVSFSLKMSSSAYAKYPVTALATPEQARRFPGTQAEVAAWSAGTSITLEMEIIHDSQGSGTGGRLTDEEIWIEAQFLGASGFPLGKFLTSTKGASSTVPFGDYFTSASTPADSVDNWVQSGMTTPRKQILSITFAPQEKGFVQYRVCLAKASATVYVCPRTTVN